MSWYLTGGTQDISLRHDIEKAPLARLGLTLSYQSVSTYVPEP